MLPDPFMMDEINTYQQKRKSVVPATIASRTNGNRYIILLNGFPVDNVPCETDEHTYQPGESVMVLRVGRDATRMLIIGNGYSSRGMYNG